MSKMDDPLNIPHDQMARMKMLNKDGRELTFTVSTEATDFISGFCCGNDNIPPETPVQLQNTSFHIASKLVGWQFHVQKIVQWHHDRNLIDGSTDKDQFCKLMQEAGELSDNICKGRDVSDDIGDMIVVLLNIAERNGLTLTDCLAKAWDDIKDRKGRMVDGIFVKEGD